MTEAEWLTSSEPSRMIWFVTENPDHQNITCCRSERKLQLLAEVWASPVCGEARYCLGSILPAGRIDNACQEIAINITAKFRPVAAQILRGMVGNPFRPYTLAPAYRTPLVLSLAEAAYEERRADGTLDLQRLAILADALEDAGVPGEVEVERVCSECGGAGFVSYNDDWLEPCLRCGKGRLERPRRGTGKVKVRIPNPLLSRLRSGGPFYRGEASLDVILNKE